MGEKHTDMEELINMHLVHGHLRGIVKCTMAGWGGAVYRIPRSLLKESKIYQDQALCNSGAYCLVGDDGGIPHIYIGQAAKRMNDKGVRGRVLEHARKNADETYWDTALMFILDDKNLSRDEICYLEHQFYCSAKAWEARTANFESVVNKLAPPLGTPAQGTITAMTKYIKMARIVLNALGCNFFDAPDSPLHLKPKKQSKPPVSDKLFVHYNRSREEVARCDFKDGQYWVLKGSTLSPLRENEPDLEKEAADKRNEYCKIGKESVLTSYVPFDSPSAAASFVSGHKANGKKYWREI